MIIIEGCDKCGKTTLAEELRTRLSWPVVKFSQPAGDAYAEYHTALDTHLKPFIADRFHLGEAIYGPLYRMTPRPTIDAINRLEDRLIARDALLVLLWDDPDRIIARFAEAGETFARVNDVDEIMWGFRVAWVESRCAKLAAVWQPGLAGIVAAAAMMMRGTNACAA